LQKSNGNQMWAADYAKGHENNAVRALKICWNRHMGTSTVFSAMEWRQPSRKLKIVTPDKESSMHTSWVGEEFEQICRRESLTEKTAEIEKTISVKEHGRERHDFDPKMFDENRFWNRRPHGRVINKNHRTPYILEFKRSSD